MRELPGGEHAKQQPGANRQHGAECQDPHIKTHAIEADDGDVARRQLPQQLDAPVRDKQSCGTAKQSQDDALGQALTRETTLTRTQRGSYGDFATTRSRAGEQQVCDVDAGDEENERDRREQQQQTCADRFPKVLVERRHPGAVGAVRIRVFSRQDSADAIHLGPPLVERDAGLEPCVDRQLMKRSAGRVRSASQRQRRPDLDRWIGEFERRWKDAHNLVRYTVQEQLAAHHGTIPTESPLPEAVGQDDDAVASRDDFVLSEEPAFNRLDSEYVKEGRRHTRADEPFRFARTGEICRERQNTRDRFEHGVHLFPVEIVGGRDDVHEHAFRLPFLPDHHETIRFLVGKWPQQHRVDGGEDSGVRADTESQGQNGDERRARLGEKQPNGVTKIEAHAIHPGPPASPPANIDVWAVARRAESFGETVENCIGCCRTPQPHAAVPRHSRGPKLCLEHADHVFAVLTADSAREREQQQTIERHPRDRASRRFARASTTAASSLAASAPATASPRRVSSKYLRRSSPSR